MERGGGGVDAELKALETAVPRFTSVVRAVPDPTARAVGTWSAGDVASHVASVFDNYVAMVEGADPVLAVTTAEIERINATWLLEDPQRDPGAASSRIENAFERLMGGLRGAVDDRTIEWHGGLTLPLSTVLCLALGEILVHGHDIASASGGRWFIPAPDARTVLDGIIELAPYYVNEESARNFSARYELRIRGGLRVTMSFEGGRLALGSPDGRADCKISADPVAFLLVSYGRIPVWGPALRGKMVAWGRKPWLGLKLPSLLRNP
jgi:uncharacterized protein (TIGR03083 family)